MVTPNFSEHEFRDNGDPIPAEFASNLRKLCVLLEELRKLSGPLIVTSGYRSKAKNDSLPGSSPNSYHLKCLAADIKSNDWTPSELAMLLLVLRANYMQGDVNQRRIAESIGEVGVEGKHLHVSVAGPFEIWRLDKYA